MKRTKLIPFKEIHQEWMKDPEFKRGYEALEPEFRLIESIIRKRIEKNMTQAELAKKMGTTQSALSRFQIGNANPSLKFLQRMAAALGGKLRIEIV